VIIASKKDIDSLFKYYDTDGSGALDYKEFAVAITGAHNHRQSQKVKVHHTGKDLGNKPSVNMSGGNINEILEKVKVKLASRGARGIIGMGKQFKIFDDDNSRSLD